MLRFLIWILLLSAIGVFLGFIYLDYQIQSKFSNKLWDVPVHVYSNYTELYPGLRISQQRLLKRLRSLGYRQTNQISNPGEYSVNANAVDLVSRRFKYSDGLRPAMAARLKFERGKVASIVDLHSQQKVNSLRLRPLLIGSLSQLSHEDRELVQLRDVPVLFLETLVAVEDRNFATHVGIDFKAILRAAWANFRADRIVQGGSTITQQLVKNVYDRDERSYKRKLLELATALVLEFRLEKHEILEAYCNEVFLGQDGKRAIHGFALASYYYFGRPLAELNVSEIATLVGMIKAPSSYHPLRNPERARQRRNVVLEVMRGHNLISQRQYQGAVNSPITAVSEFNRARRSYASYVDAVLRQLSRHLSDEEIASGNFSVFSNMDIVIQRAAEQALSTEIGKLEKKRNIQSGSLQGAVVVIEPDTGKILAIVGGRKAYIGMFNRALDARRPIGSLIKPLIYLSAFTHSPKFTLASIIKDLPIAVEHGSDRKVWRPQNFDDKYLGEITALEAIAQSRNVPTVRLGLKVGMNSITRYLQQFGLAYEKRVYPSLLLGTSELSPLSVAQIYQVLANSGYKIGLRAVSSIGRETEIIINAPGTKTEMVASPEYVQLILFAMQQVVATGTGRSLLNSLDSNLNLAGKTGTTDEFRDSWYAGMSGNLLAVVWLGRDDNQSTGLTGASGALKVWAALMQDLDLRPLNLNPSSNHEFAQIDLNTGKIASRECENSQEILFVRGTVPKQRAYCGRTRAEK